MNNIVTIAIGLGALALGGFYFLNVENVDANDIRNKVTDAKFKNVERVIANSKSPVIPTTKEYIARKAQNKAQKAEAHLKSCRVGAIQQGANVHFVSTYEGNALSNIDLTHGERATEVETVNIEPGTTPLVIVAGSSSPLIWKFTGSTERIAEVILSPANKRTGLSPNTTLAAYNINRLSLPSGQSLTKKELRKLRNVKPFRYDRKMIDMRENDHGVFKFFPEGVHILNEADVVASGPVKAVQTLPDRAGIAQLVSRKKIVLKNGV